MVVLLDGMKEGDANTAVPPIGVILMPSDFLTNSPIVAAYREKTPGSARLADEAAEISPAGLPMTCGT